MKSESKAEAARAKAKASIEAKAKAKTRAANAAGMIVIDPPNMGYVRVTIRGDAPYIQHKFSKKAREIIRIRQEEGPAAKNVKPREGKDFDALYEGAKHKTAEGWYGIPAPAFRSAMISACRVAGLVMTKMKLTVFALAEGIDEDDGTPLCRITQGEPEIHEGTVRLETGVTDIRVRPMWREGWEARVVVRWDKDQLSRKSVVNLLARAGMQVGIGEGRPDSKKSAGQGWGTFEITEVEELDGPPAKRGEVAKRGEIVYREGGEPR